MANDIRKITKDKLDFAPTVDAIVRVIRNPDVKLPLTIAINGDWGSGKSSVMSLVRDELKYANTYNPALPANHYVNKARSNGNILSVWFNAWHLEGENNLLNAFMREVIGAYEKKYGLLFRIKLLLYRMLELHWLRKLGLFLVLGVVMPSFLLFLLHFVGPAYQLCHTTVGPALRGIGFTYFTDYWTFITTIGALLADGGHKDNSSVLAFAGLIISAALSIFTLKKNTTPSGISALFQLIPVDKLQMSSDDQSLDFRDQFKKDFWDVVKVGDPNQRFVVFIDDMDRISGDVIYELLEGMNFISDTASIPGDQQLSSNLVFVIGMASHEVARNLGTYLNKIAPDDVDQRTRGMLFIEKMMDMMISVPAGNNDHLFLHPVTNNAPQQTIPAA